MPLDQIAEHLGIAPLAVEARLAEALPTTDARPSNP